MTTIYHNPQCSKSRQTLQLLKDHGHCPTVIEYLKTVPDQTALRQILKMLGCRPIEIVRKNEALFSELKLEQIQDDDDAILQALLKNPRLIQRPIVVHNGQAALGRPPQKVLQIL